MTTSNYTLDNPSKPLQCEHMSNTFWRPSAPWKPTKYGYQVTMSDIKPFVSNGHLPVPSIGMWSMNEFRPKYGSDFTEILYWQFTRVGPGVHKTTFTIWNK